MTEAVVDPLNEIINRITSIIDPEKIILFGSRAKYKINNLNSDYDICIILDGKYKKRELSQQIYTILFGIGVSVDIIIENSQDYEKLKHNKFMIYSQIDKEGKIIYER